MGYELNQLMKRYGLTTSTMSPYSGVAAPTVLAADATDAQKKQFNDEMSAYVAQRGAYDAYKKEYQNRIGSTSPYENSPLFKGQKQNWDTNLVAPTYSSSYTPVGAGTANPSYADNLANEWVRYGDAQTDPGRNAWLNTRTRNLTYGEKPYVEMPAKTVTTDTTGTGGTTTGDTTTTNTTGTTAGTGATTATTNTGITYYPGYEGESGSWMDASGNRYSQSDNGSFSPYRYESHGGHIKHFSRGGGSGKINGGIEDLVDRYDLANPTELPVTYAAADTGTRSDATAEAPVASVPVPAGTLRGLQESAVRAGEPPMQRGPVPPAESNPEMTTPSPTGGATLGAAPAPAPASSGQTPLEALYQKYLGQQSKSAEMAAAEKNVLDKKNALIELLKEQASKTEDNAPSKAEMYFRLAAALAAPTKTGGIMENVSLAAKELADFQRSTTDAKKAAAAAKLQLLLKTGEIDAQTAEKELANLKEGEKERRDTAKSFAMEEFRAGEKKSEKQAELVNADEQAAAARGLKKGTPAFQSYVNELQDRRKAKEDEELAAKKAEAARKLQGETKLNPKEFELKAKLQTEMATYEEALKDVETAIQNAKNAFTGSVKDQLMMAAYKNKPFGKADPKVTATENMKSAIGSSTLQNAASMKGSLSDKDLGFLRNISGEIATSPDARDTILARAKEKLERAIARVKEEHALVSQGKFGIKVDEKGTE